MTSKNSIRYISLVALSALSITYSAHANVDGAQKFIQNVSDKAIALIKDGKTSDAKKEQKLVKLFEDSVDTAWIGKFVIGNNWNTASEPQKKEYIKAHHDFLINSYVPKFKQYTDQKIVVKKSSEEDKKEYMVQTEIVKTDSPSINVNYRIREDAKGKYHIYDVIAEGVSLLTTQRSEFSSILARSNLEDLTAKLKERAKTNSKDTK